MEVPKSLYMDCGCCSGKVDTPQSTTSTSIASLWQSIFSVKIDAMHANTLHVSLLAKFMLCCKNNIHFTALLSSAKGVSQSGALFVMWETNDKKLRQPSDGPILSPVEQYVDCVVYDTHTEENVVIEVKTEPDVDVESQNNEQMVGIGRDKQAVMLGLEVKGSYSKSVVED